MHVKCSDWINPWSRAAAAAAATAARWFMLVCYWTNLFLFADCVCGSCSWCWTRNKQFAYLCSLIAAKLRNYWVNHSLLPLDQHLANRIRARANCVPKFTSNNDRRRGSKCTPIGGLRSNLWRRRPPMTQWGAIRVSPSSNDRRILFYLF